MNNTSFSYHDLFQRFLQSDKAVSQDHLKILSESWSKPKSFWEPYFDEHKQQRSFKSHLWQSYDFYHDMLIRHCTDREAIAFRSYQGLAGWQELSYLELAQKSATLAADWEYQGLLPEHKVCIVLPFGSEFVIYLMAAFKLGLSVCWLLPEAPSYLRNRLSLLEVDYILCSDEQKPFLEKFDQELIIPRHPSGLPTNLISTAYAPDKIALSLFDPLTSDYENPLELNSEFLLLQSLRDGHLFMELGPQKSFCAPGSKSLLNEPSQLLACLANGATYVDVDLESFRQEDLDLSFLDTTTIAVSRELRDLLLESHYQLNNCTFWFYNLRNYQPSISWQDFFNLQQNDQRFCGSTFSAAGDAGSTIYSEKSHKVISQHVIPVPGIPWTSEHLLINGIPSSSALSILVHKGETLAAPRPPSIMLHRQQKKWFFAGTQPNRPDSIHLSLTEILATVHKILPACPAHLLEINDSWKGSPAKVLLIFAPYNEVAPQNRDLEQQVQTVIEEELGLLYSLDRIEYFPFMPPSKEGELDPRKCTSQYQMGILQKKRQFHFFEELNNLKRLINDL
jgi:hypothetical protein